MINIRLSRLTILAFASLLSIPIIYGGPLLFVGLDDINMVRHFDHGESQIALGWLEAYRNGPLFSGPVEVYMAYPKFFYNLAGVVLYPLAIFSELDYKTIVITWRIFNTIFAGLASIALFVLARCILQSTLAAYISALLLSITPEFLIWSSNVRPNPLEQLLIFLGLIGCLKILDQPTPKWFMISTILTALAFATKFGSIPLVLLIPMISVYCIWKKRTHEDEFTKFIKDYSNLFGIGLPIALFFGLLMTLLISISLVHHDFSSQDLLYSWTSPGIDLHQQTRLRQILQQWHNLVNLIVWGGLIISISTTTLGALLWYKAKILKSAIAVNPSLALFAWLIGSIFVITGLTYIAVYFLVSPAHIANPSHFLSHIGFEFRYVALGASHGLGGSTPSIADFLGQLFIEMHWSWLFFIPPLIVALVFSKHADKYKSGTKNARVILSLFIIISLSLFVATRYPSIRHILPAIGIIYIYVAAQITPLINTSHLNIKLYTATFLGICILAGATLQTTQSYKHWANNMDKPNDIGMHVGAWLSENYSPDTKIMVDSWIFYVPPEFENIKNTQIIEQPLMKKPLADQIKEIKAAINEYQPEIIITTDSDIHTSNVQLEELFPIDYQIAALFPSTQRRDKYNSVSIYRKQ